MEFAWLEDFLMLADCGHFSRAAERRNVSQPAFSRRVRMLEDWVGVPLFNRDTHRVELTPAGLEFRPIAEDIMRRVVSGRELAREVAQVSASSLRFVCTNVLSLTFFPGWLERVEAAAASPQSSISLVTDNMADCERLMTQGQAQFMLCHHHPAAQTSLDSTYFRCVDVGEDLLIPVSAPTAPGAVEPMHALPGSATSPVAHLAFSSVSGMGRIIASTRTRDAPPAWLSSVFTAHLAMVLLTMARRGRGVAWLPASLIQRELGAGELVRSADTDAWDIPMQIRLYRPRARQSVAAEAFWTQVTRTSAAASPT
ncbi:MULTISPECIES: LysR family transcriptional regulator [unclassified Phenylobacterium]|uniref:LysR family transcriptional regulator n=1 Tax=unclassified Phenylobacterium TaxID=2640670 RepID=UPI00083B28D3|nr:MULTISPECIES: LysR family transcriptional regulator [unclassified Phenylobacterium]